MFKIGDMVRVHHTYNNWSYVGLTGRILKISNGIATIVFRSSLKYIRPMLGNIATFDLRY